MSALAQAIYKLCGIKHLRTSPRHPATNSRAENLNKILIRTLRAFCSEQHTWPDFLPIVAMAHRATVITSTCVSPFFAMYHQNMRLPIDANCVPDLPKQISVQNFIERFNPKLDYETSSNKTQRRHITSPLNRTT